MLCFNNIFLSRLIIAFPWQKSFFMANKSLLFLALFQNGDESRDNKRRGSSSSSNLLLGSRLSNCVRNGRSVVHKNLEDNYGAVISANHEALAQILEQQVRVEMYLNYFHFRRIHSSHTLRQNLNLLSKLILIWTRDSEIF